MNYNYVENIHKSQKYNIQWKEARHLLHDYMIQKHVQLIMFLEGRYLPSRNNVVTEQTNKNTSRVLGIFFFS